MEKEKVKRASELLNEIENMQSILEQFELSEKNKDGSYVIFRLPTSSCLSERNFYITNNNHKKRLISVIREILAELEEELKNI